MFLLERVGPRAALSNAAWACQWYTGIITGVCLLLLLGWSTDLNHRRHLPMLSEQKVGGTLNQLFLQSRPLTMFQVA